MNFALGCCDEEHRSTSQQFDEIYKIRDEIKAAVDKETLHFAIPKIIQY